MHSEFQTFCFLHVEYCGRRTKVTPSHKLVRPPYLLVTLAPCCDGSTTWSSTIHLFTRHTTQPVSPLYCNISGDLLLPTVIPAVGVSVAHHHHSSIHNLIYRLAHSGANFTGIWQGSRTRYEKWRRRSQLLTPENSRGCPHVRDVEFEIRKFSLLLHSYSTYVGSTNTNYAQGLS